MGYAALYVNTSGHDNVAIGHWAGDSYLTGTYNTFIGTSADAGSEGLTNATAIGYGAEVTASNMVRIGNDTVSLIQGAVNFTTPSDIRIKKDVEDIGQGLAFIKALRPVQYRLKKGNDRIDFGFIAQHIEALLGTDYNVLGIGGDADRTLSLRYTDFIAPMVKAMQEQQEMIEQLKAEVTELKRMLGK
jgi:trimeric autotransporter adhesin